MQDGPTPYRMIRTTNVRDGRIDLSTCRYVDEATYERWTRRAKVIDGDILLTREAPIGEVGYVQNLGQVFLGQRIMQYRPDPAKVSPRYLYYAFRSSDLQHQFGSHEGSGSVVSHIRVADCHEFKVPLPTRAEQDAIAQLMGALDDKIELNRRMNDTLEAMAQAIFRDWFVDFGPTRRKLAGTVDPIEIMGGIVQDASRAAELAALFPDAIGGDGLPEGWCVENIGSHIDIFDSKRIPLSNREREKRIGPYPYHGATSVMGYVDDFLFDDVLLLVGEDGSVARPNGKPFTQYVWGKIWVNNHAHVLKGSSFSTEQLKILFDQVDIAPFVTGAVQPKLNQGNLKSVPFIIAERSVHSALDQLIEPFFASIRSRQEENQTLAATRDLLLPKLMSGEIRLRDAEAIAEAAT